MTDDVQASGQKAIPATHKNRGDGVASQIERSRVGHERVADFDFGTTRVSSSRQERSRRGAQSDVAFDLDALFLDRRRQTQLAPEFTRRLIDRKLRRS